MGGDDILQEGEREGGKRACVGRFFLLGPLGPISKVSVALSFYFSFSFCFSFFFFENI